MSTNTFIIVASDNGPEPGAGSARPFRGHKGNLYEGGIREPFIVWAPGLQRREARGTVNETTVVAAVDLLPSVLGLAGLAPPDGIQFDGEDVSRAFLGLAAETRTKPLFWIRPPDRPGPKGDKWPDLAIRIGNWKLLVMEDGSGAQLYDVSRDPGESRNLAEDSVNAQSLRLQVLAWRKSLPIALPASGSNAPGADR